MHDKKAGIPSFLDDPLLKSADTGLSYRKINELDSKGLATNQRKTNKQWRNFSINEVALMLLTDKLRSLGFTDHEQLKTVREWLSKSGVSLQHNAENPTAEWPLVTTIGMASLTGTAVYLIITKSSIIGVFDYQSYLSWSADVPQFDEDFITIRLDTIFRKIVNNLDERLTFKPDDFLLSSEVVQLSQTELAAIQTIQNGEYESVELKLADGHIRSLSCKRSIPVRKGGASKREILEAIGSKEYGTVTIQFEGGKMVYVNETDRVRVL